MSDEDSEEEQPKVAESKKEDRKVPEKKVAGPIGKAEKPHEKIASKKKKKNAISVNMKNEYKKSAKGEFVITGFQIDEAKEEQVAQRKKTEEEEDKEKKKDDEAKNIADKEEEEKKAKELKKKKNAESKM